MSEIERMLETKILTFADARATGRLTADVGPHQDICVVPSPEGRVEFPGTKCEHGGYIPSTHPDPDRAPYCSACYLYIISKIE